MADIILPKHTMIRIAALAVLGAVALASCAKKSEPLTTTTGSTYTYTSSK